jgi:hypothetical protein
VLGVELRKHHLFIDGFVYLSTAYKLFQVSLENRVTAPENV